MENKIYIDSLGYNFLEPILVEKQDNKIIITEEDLKKVINQAYESGKVAGMVYPPCIQTPPKETYPSYPSYPYYPYYPNYPIITWSNGSEIKCTVQGVNNEQSKK